ncbi:MULTISPECIES: hypothetical protein [Paenarthrobacter]|uniref:hypothetical protein n=1 Tax=Paenarthrobacter TaxID=1742992 RepID=UPI000FEC6945|nr:hypothetical protein [Paenarthrobacter ureafaciens]MCX8453577.1 hypothetical protein [Paenarthrobacter ureafaciens]MCY0973236.1 hypothetical protein [Paenarthrobacter ureafaciens]RWW91442.1 hypothetical protein AUR_18815 [Paenarthrobacter ureafaciens]
MSGHYDNLSETPSKEPSPANAPVKTPDATPRSIEEDAAESWDNEGGHDRAASAERPIGSDLP